MQTIGERIKYLRNNYPTKMTQADLAARLGIKTASVGQWENGQTKGLKPENLLGVIEIFNCDLRWLVTGQVTYKLNNIQEPRTKGIVIMSGKRYDALELIQKLNEEYLDQAITYLEFLYNKQESTGKTKVIKPPVLHGNINNGLD